MIKRRIVSHSVSSSSDWEDGTLEGVATSDDGLGLNNDIPDSLEPGDEGEEVQQLRMNLFIVREIDRGNTDFEGENLIENSNDFTHYNGHNGADIEFEENVEVEEWGTESATKFTVSGGDSSLKLSPQVEAGYEVEVTYSVWMKNDGENPISLNYNGLSVSEQSHDYELEPGEERRMVVTGVTREDYDWFQTQYRNEYDDESDMELILWREQVEYGESVSGWLPHIDDLSDEYDDELEDEISDFQEEREITVDGIADNQTMIALMSYVDPDFNFEGVRTSPEVDISDAVTAYNSVIEWEDDEPDGSSVTIEVSADDGETWEEASNGSPIPVIEQGMDISDVSLQTRQILETDGLDISPLIQSISIEVYPAPRRMQGDFIDEVYDYYEHINAGYPDDESDENYPQDGEDFEIPTRDEMEALLLLGIRMKTEDLIDAQRIIDDYDFSFEIVHYEDEPRERRYRMLREVYEEGYHRGWGMFVWNEQPQMPWTVQVTHPIFDQYTSDVGSRVFVRGQAYAFFMHGTHRYSYPSAGDIEGPIYSDRIALSDPSGTDFTPMHCMQLAESRRNNVFFQMHGFTKSNPGRGEYPGCIVSEGSTASAASIRVKSMANELTREGLRSGLYHFSPEYDELTMYNDLGAETNRGSAWTDGLLGQQGHFIHMEIESTFRFNAPNFTADAVTRAGRRVYPHMDTFLDPEHNLTDSPSLDVDSDDDGIADDWVQNDTIYGDTHYEVDENEDAQMIQITEAEERALASIDQTVSISATGIPYRFTVMARNAQVVSDFQARVYIAWEDSNGDHIRYSEAEQSYSSEEFIQLIGEDTPPNDAAQARILLEVEAPEAGSSGIAWFRDCRFYRREDKFFTEARTARFHDGDPSKVDIHFSAPLTSAGDPDDWDSDLTIEGTELKDHGYTVELDVSGTERGEYHYFALANGILDEYGEVIRSNRVFASGISEDDLFSGENTPTSRIRKNLEMFPIQDPWDRVQTSGTNIIRTRTHHPNIYQHHPGAIIGLKKRSNEFIFTHYQQNVEPQEELWFRAEIYVPEWHEQEGRSLYVARISENEDNIDDGIRLNLTYDDDGDLFWQIRDRNGSGTLRESDRRVTLGQWQTVEIVARVGEVEHELWIDDEQVATRTLDNPVDSFEHVRIGTTYATDTGTEQLEIYMKGIKISTSRYGMTSSNVNHIFAPMITTEFIEINQLANWTNLTHHRDLREVDVAVPINMNGEDVRIRAWLEDEYGVVLDETQSDFVEQGEGTTTLEFNEPIQPGTFLRLDSEDESGNVGETSTYNYVYIPPVQPLELEDADVVTIRNQSGDVEGLTDVYDFERSIELNDDYTISFSIFESTGNYQSFPMLENENIVQFQGENFRIKRVDRYISFDMPIKDIEARHTFFDTIDDYVYDELSETLSIEDAVEHAFDNTDIAYEIEGDFDTVLFENFGDDTALALIQEIMDRYNAEFKITGNNSILIREQIGDQTHAQFRHRHNIETIDYYIDTSDLSTYIEGFGAMDDETGNYAQTAYYTSPNADMYMREDGSVKLKHAEPIRDDRYTDYDSLMDALEREIKDEPDYSIEIEVAEVIRNLDNDGEYSFDDFSIGDNVFVIHEPLNLNMEARVIRYVDFPLDNESPVVTIGNFRMDNTRLQAGSGTSLGGSSSGDTGGGTSSGGGVDFSGDFSLYDNEIRSNNYVWMDNLGIHQQHPDDNSRLVFHGPTGSSFDRMLDVTDDFGRNWIEEGNFRPDLFSDAERAVWLPDEMPEGWMPDQIPVEILPDEIPEERLPDSVVNGNGGGGLQDTIDDPLNNYELEPDQATQFNIDATTRYVSFAIRFDEEASFTLERAYRADGTDSVLLEDYETIIDEEDTEMHVYRMEVDFPHMRFRLRNTGDSEISIDDCQIGFIP